MNNTTRRLVFALGGIVILGLLAVAVIWFGGGSGEPSTPISVPTSPATVVREPATTEDAESAAAAATDEAVPTDEAAETAEPAEDAASAQAASTDEAAATGPVLFAINRAESQVSFTIYEELRGQPTDVVGTTSEVAANITVDFADPQAATVSTIRINARTLATDNEFRNRAIRTLILRSAEDAYEFIDFIPTRITGLPEAVTMGQPFTFDIVGDLQIIETTSPVTFNVTVTPVSETRLEGTATATVLRSDFGLTIPNAPGVANVSDDVTLTISFVAEPGQ